jgi:hypothetical protein
MSNRSCVALWPLYRLASDQCLARIGLLGIHSLAGPAVAYGSAVNEEIGYRPSSRRIPPCTTDILSVARLSKVR